MIDLKNKIIIFDNIKTGSTSIRSILKRDSNCFFGKHTKLVTESFMYFDHDKDSKVFTCQKLYEKYKKNITNSIFIDKEDIIENFVKVASVRNPYDRLLSLYRYRLDKRSGLVKGMFLNKKDFEKYIIKICSDPYFEKTNGMSLTENIKIDDKEFLNLDHVIRFENYEEDVKKIFNEVNINVGVIPHKKKTAKDIYIKDFYSKKCIDLINENYEKDFSYFNYEMIK